MNYWFGTISIRGIENLILKHLNFLTLGKKCFFKKATRSYQTGFTSSYCTQLKTGMTLTPFMKIYLKKL